MADAGTLRAALNQQLAPCVGKAVPKNTGQTLENARVFRSERLLAGWICQRVESDA